MNMFCFVLQSLFTRLPWNQVVPSLTLLYFNTWLKRHMLQMLQTISNRIPMIKWWLIGYAADNC